jgi:hypothetical protein
MEVVRGGPEKHFSKESRSYDRRERRLESQLDVKHRDANRIEVRTVAMHEGTAIAVF